MLEGSTTPGYDCLESVMDIPVGRCVGAGSAFACTSSKFSCLDGTERFIENDPTCTVVGDHHPDRQRPHAIYGECARKGTSENSVESHKQIGCFWDQIDCTGGLSGGIHWQKDGTEWDETCTCDMVDTGACQDSSNDFYCAVSQYGCDDDSQFRPYWDLPENVQCQLCQPLFADDIEEGAQIIDSATSYPTSPPFDETSPATPPAGTPVSAPTSRPVVDPSSADGMDPTFTTTAPTFLRTDKSNASDEKKIDATVLGVTLALVVSLFLIGFVTRAVRKRKREQKEPNQEEKADPDHSDPSEPEGVFS